MKFVLIIFSALEYLLDANAQAYIPKVLNGELHLDTSSSINLNRNQESKIDALKEFQVLAF